MSSGKEALEKVEEIDPDLILMDIMLKGDISGIDVAEKITAHRDIPIIYLTAYTDQDTLQRAKVTMPFGYILKPFEDRELFTTIEIALFKYKTEKQLKESRRWLSTTLNSIGDAVITTDTGGVITFMNPVAEALTGWKKEEAYGKMLPEVFNIVDESTGKIAESPIGKVLLDGKVVDSVDHRILISRDGKEIHIGWNAAPIKDEMGNITGIVLVFRDITERKNAEKALLLDESRMEALLRLYQMTESPLHDIIDFSLEEGIRLTGSSVGYIAFLNDDETNITIYSWSRQVMEECMVRNKTRTYTIKDAGIWVDAVRQRKPVIINEYDNTRGRLPEGHIGIKRLMIVPLFNGNQIVAIAGVGNKKEEYNQSDVRQLSLLLEGMWGISQRKSIEQALKDSEERYRTLIENTGEGIGIVDQNRNFVFTNPAEERIFGVSSGELIGKNLREFTDGEQFRIILEQTKRRRKGESGSYEIEITRKDGEKRRLNLTCTPRFSQDHEYIGAFVIFHDITERKQMEDALLLKNRELEITGSIISTINRSEELQDMLDGVLKGVLDLLEIDSGAIYLYGSDEMQTLSIAAVSARTDKGRAIRFKQSMPPTFIIDRDCIMVDESDSGHYITGWNRAPAMIRIMVKGRIIGIMALYAGDRSLNESILPVLRGIGSQLGIAIENHRLFRKLHDTSRYLSDVINGSPDAMLTISADGRILSFNKSASKALKYLPEEIVGKHISSLLPYGESIDLIGSKSHVREFIAKDGETIRLNISTSQLYKDDPKSEYIVTLKNLSEIVGLGIVPLMENAVDTDQKYYFEPGYIYMVDKQATSHHMEIFADQVKHNIQGLCVTRQSPNKIREKYGLEKTPIIWLNGNDNVPGENCMKPDNLASLTATLHKFISEAENGLILLDGMEYLMMRNSYESLLKFVHYLNDKVMISRSRVLFCIDPLTLDERQYRLLLSEMCKLELNKKVTDYIKHEK